MTSLLFSITAHLLAVAILADIKTADASSPSPTTATRKPCRGCPLGTIMTPYCFDDPCNLDLAADGQEDTKRDPWACRCVFDRKDEEDSDDNDDYHQPTEAASDEKKDATGCQGCPMFYELNFWCMNDPCNLVVNQEIDNNIPENFRCKCKVQSVVVVMIILVSILLLFAISTCVVLCIRTRCADGAAIRPHGEKVDMGYAYYASLVDLVSGRNATSAGANGSIESDDVELKEVSLISEGSEPEEQHIDIDDGDDKLTAAISVHSSSFTDSSVADVTTTTAVEGYSRQSTITIVDDEETPTSSASDRMRLNEEDKGKEEDLKKETALSSSSTISQSDK